MFASACGVGGGTCMCMCRTVFVCVYVCVRVCVCVRAVCGVYLVSHFFSLTYTPKLTLSIDKKAHPPPLPPPLPSLSPATSLLPLRLNSYLPCLSRHLYLLYRIPSLPPFPPSCNLYLHPLPSK